MGKASRDKGKRGELEVASIFQAHGFDVNRTPNSGGLRIQGDLYGNLPGVIVEVKRCERLDMWAWLKQAHDEALATSEVGVDVVPVPWVVFRRNMSPWYVTAPLTDQLQLLKEARGG